MVNMNIDDMLDVLDDMIEEAWKVPFAGGKRAIDESKLKDLIDEIRMSVPQEIRQARAIVADRTEIITNAKKEAEDIVRRAEERARTLVAKEEIVRQAQDKANEIMNQAQQRSREMRQAANDFADNLLKETEDVLVKSITDVRQTRGTIRNSKQTKMSLPNE